MSASRFVGAVFACLGGLGYRRRPPDGVVAIAAVGRCGGWRGRRGGRGRVATDAEYAVMLRSLLHWLCGFSARLVCRAAMAT